MLAESVVQRRVQRRERGSFDTWNRREDQSRPSFHSFGDKRFSFRKTVGKTSARSALSFCMQRDESCLLAERARGESFVKKKRGGGAGGGRGWGLPDARQDSKDGRKGDED